MQTHKDAKYLRNKEFPHLEQLRLVWGGDYATGAAAETPADAIENLEKESYFDCDDEEDEEEEDEAMSQPLGEGATAPVQKDGGDNSTKAQAASGSASEAAKGKEGRPPTATQTGAAAPAFATKGKAVAKPKRKNNDEDISDLRADLKEVVGAYKYGNQRIDKIATYFEKETEGSDRRMKVYELLLKLEGLSNADLMEAAEYMLKDASKLDNLFAMPDEMRKEYVVKTLAEARPYRPTFDFDPNNP